MEEVLSHFGQEPEKAREGYETFLADGLANPKLLDRYRPQGKRFIGSGAFIERMKGQAKEPIRREERRLVSLSGLEELAATLEKPLGLSTDVLASPTQVRTISQARKVLAYVARDLYRFPVTQIATFLHRDPTAISQILRQSHKIQSWDLTRQALAALTPPPRPL
jgi:hypothetical protein